MATVHLIDALPYVFRAYFSLPSSITDRDGNPANAVRGYTDFLLRYLLEEEPTHVACLFDESLVTSFRNELYPAYKEQRELPPPELEAQLKACQAVSRALGLATFADQRYEADDLIATLARPLVRKEHSVVVVSSDKDLAQLVGDHVTFHDFARGTRLGREEVIERWGIRPEQIVDWIGLAGDSVDNIPGVRGVGPKTAVALLNVFEDLDDLYSRLDEVATVPVRGAKTLGAKLEAARETAMLSRQLAVLAEDAPVKAGLRELSWKGASRKELEPLAARLEMERFLERVPRWA